MIVIQVNGIVHELLANEIRYEGDCVRAILDGKEVGHFERPECWYWKSGKTEKVSD